MKVFYVVHGAVQGVGYRWHVASVGRKYGLKGMVRNVKDGSVEIFVQDATAEQLKSFEKEINVSMENGPQVFKVEKYTEGSDGFREFGPYEKFEKEATV